MIKAQLVDKAISSSCRLYMLVLGIIWRFEVIDLNHQKLILDSAKILMLI